MNPSTSILPNPNLLVQHTNTPRGRGVFTDHPIPQGTIVEVSPIVEIHHPWNDLPLDVKRVVYDWGYLIGQPATLVSAIALGLGSLFNHTSNPNVSYTGHAGDKTIIFTAMRDIAAGEELTIDYNADMDPETGEDWFDLVGITKMPD